MYKLSIIVVGFFRTKQEVVKAMATREDGSQVELLQSLPSKLLHPESDVSERSLRPHDSLTKIVIQEKFVSTVNYVASANIKYFYTTTTLLLGPHSKDS